MAKNIEPNKTEQRKPLDKNQKVEVDAPPTKSSAEVAKSKNSQDGRNRTSFWLGTALMGMGLLLLLFALFAFAKKFIKPIEDSSLPVPQLESLTERTNKENVLIKGKVKSTEGHEVMIYINDEYKNNRTTTDSNGYFSTNILLSIEGEYKFKAVLIRKGILLKRSQFSNEVSTFLDKSNPSVALSEIPTETHSEKLSIKGKANEEGSIKVIVGDEEFTAKTDEKGNFTLPIVLKKGKNTVRIYAEDIAGNRSVEETVTINYLTKASLNGDGTKTSRSKDTLPRSAGNLSDAMSKVFNNKIAILFGFLALLTYGASYSLGWLIKEYKVKRH